MGRQSGTTHYGETIPPEYANKDRSELDKTGRVIKKDDVLTPEELRAKEQADAKKTRGRCRRTRSATP